LRVFLAWQPEGGRFSQQFNGEWDGVLVAVGSFDGSDEIQTLALTRNGSNFDLRVAQGKAIQHGYLWYERPGEVGVLFRAD